MPSLWTRLSLFRPVIERRLGMHAETASEDAALWIKSLQRRLFGGAIALIGTLLSLLLGSAWLLESVWHSSWRIPTLAALLATYMLCASAGVALALWPARRGHGPFARLRKDLSGDLALLSELFAPGGLLQRSRPKASDPPLQDDGAAGTKGTFPRSTAVRLLLGWSGLARIFS